MYDLETFASALRGDDVRLREFAGAYGLVCTAVELSSVFVIRPADDGGQRGTLAVVGASGGGGVSEVRLPRSFSVRRIGHDGGCFVLTADDGREVRGTPGQFGAWPKIVTAEHNPAYEQHLEEAYPGDAGAGGGQLVVGDCVDDRAKEIACAGASGAVNKVLALTKTAEECPAAANSPIDLFPSPGRPYDTICASAA
ncbi:hypothetical protein [Streptomyces clavifer]|uniref:hypothetical protein n=1 Tax=Streptomyces clavifer TaxID=68188 RepID=UPI00366A220A